MELDKTRVTVTNYLPNWFHSHDSTLLVRESYTTGTDAVPLVLLTLAVLLRLMLGLASRGLLGADEDEDEDHKPNVLRRIRSQTMTATIIEAFGFLRPFDG